jgi:hypothetical protein
MGISNFIHFVHPTNQNITISQDSIVFLYPCTSSYNCSPINITLSQGFYILETWGAAGGNGKSNEPGGKGGYARGILKVLSSTKFFLFIGGKGESGITNRDAIGGFNGGGNGKIGPDRYPHGSGGGSTDFRTSVDIESRILVAGGGGGAGGDVQGGAFGGFGGGLVAGDGTGRFPGKGATVNRNGIGSSVSNLNITNGTLLYGGNGINGPNSSGTGGGGGYYGGGGAYCSASGGGSGYFGQLKTGVTIPGNKAFPKVFNQEETEVGHSGNGAAKITMITAIINYHTSSCTSNILNIFLYLFVMS